MRSAQHHMAFIIAGIMAALFINGNTLAQAYRSPVIMHDGYNEKYAVLTDRNIYVAGEELCFSVFNLSDRHVRKAGWSKIFYIELVQPDGAMVAGVKIPLLEDEAAGFLQIPDNIPTGYYLLRSYTRWMRNFSPRDYAYNRIKIVNPYIQEVNIPAAGNSESSTVLTPNDSTNVLMMPIGCKTDKAVYNSREKVMVSIDIPPFIKNISDSYCISVARCGAVDPNGSGVVKMNEASDDEHYLMQFIPETKGLSVSGKVLNNNGETVRNTFVQLSMLRENGDYLGYYTDLDGKFYFSLLPFTGRQDMFISAHNVTGDRLEIRIDKDFANHNGAISTEAFTLSDNERSLAVEMMINSQVKKAYAKNRDTAVTRDEQDSTGLYFYGQPCRTVYIDDFIALPTLGEVFFELVPEVSVTKRKGVNTVVVSGHPRVSADLASYNPLILLDLVPISNLDDLLAVPPRKLQRIEIINNLYIKGDIIYGGVVSIFSKKGDLAGINLPLNSSFFVIEGLSSQQTSAVESFADNQNESRIPDFRNCLYWNPKITIRPGNKASLEFTTSDNKGDYEFIIRGFSSDGVLMEKRCRFGVR